MPDIFDEVDEDLRAERMRRLLRRYGGLLLLAAVAVVAGVGGYQAWQWYDARQAAGAAQSFMAATRLADSRSAAEQQRAVPLLAAVAERGGSYRALAQLRQAALRDQAGDVQAASALWDQVAHDGAADRLLRDFATLQWAAANVDTGDPAAVAARLDKLTGPENPWHSMALQLQAALALRQGRPDAARNTLRRLAADPTAPQGVRQQAASLMAQLGGAEKAGGS